MLLIKKLVVLLCYFCYFLANFCLVTIRLESIFYALKNYKIKQDVSNIQAQKVNLIVVLLICGVTISPNVAECYSDILPGEQVIKNATLSQLLIDNSGDNS